MGAARNRTIASLVLLLILAACSREQGPASPAATLGAAPSETASAPSEAPSETEPADPYAIPADPKDIDKEYVERVIEALNEGVVAATRLVASERKVTPAVKRELSATHLPRSQQGYLASFREVLKDRKTAELFRAGAGSVEVVEVKEIITATPRCIFAFVRQDTNRLTTRRVRPFDVYYHLEAAATPLPERNPTPWMVAADAQPRADGKGFSDPCAHD